MTGELQHPQCGHCPQCTRGVPPTCDVCGESTAGVLLELVAHKALVLVWPFDDSDSSREQQFLCALRGHRWTLPSARCPAGVSLR
mmetsp:Transcript_11850/g.35440  ORF Transcript_11850/g.35440 Transcript_11850/m.35440 type:complete len:85 (-) Transcript_11850:278-532(-)